MKNMALRYLTAILVLPLLVLLIQHSPSWSFDMVIAAAFLLALSEALFITRKFLVRIPVVFGMVNGFIAVGSLVMIARGGPASIGYACILIMTAGICAYTIAAPRNSMSEAACLAGLLLLLPVLICWGGGALILIRETGFSADSRNLIFLLLATVWTGDAGAMHIGRSLGKHKLCPLVSPNKTVEGFAGAVAAGWIGGTAAYHIWSYPFPLWHVIAVTPALIVLAHVGDLFISILKRTAAVKDSGFLIPGHGGFLDRLDNLLFTSPFFYIFASIAWPG
ncbi:phosphatidate cytidylyltransferase [bacterium]|nr:phosphatidate cytidylyltransferase [candidate division CSSED10-310 bacterium]